MQALVGKTGKEGLKRRCLECDASRIHMGAAKRARQLLDRYELDEVRDVSAGAATFYVFVSITVKQVSRVMRKSDFCLCENKDTDQLRGDREADQRLCFRYRDSTIPLFFEPEISSL